ncbi:unnamed protein product, partial [Effrenium voratum]
MCLSAENSMDYLPFSVPRTCFSAARPRAPDSDPRQTVELPVTASFEALPANGDFCTSCQEILHSNSFSRKMRTKPPEKRRCSQCVEAEADAEAAAAEAAGYPAEGAEGEEPQSKMSELRQLCAESAKEAEKVTGLKALRGGRG